MNNLKKGILDIGGVIIAPKCKLEKVILDFGKDNIDIIKLNDITTVIQFLEFPTIGSKKFAVDITFKNEVLWSVRLMVDDPTIDEWDFWGLQAEHREWLLQELGKSDGVKDEIRYGWGSISSWWDPRSCTSGITILYSQK